MYVEENFLIPQPQMHQQFDNSLICIEKKRKAKQTKHNVVPSHYNIKVTIKVK